MLRQHAVSCLLSAWTPCLHKRTRRRSCSASPGVIGLDSMKSMNQQAARNMDGSCRGYWETALPASYMLLLGSLTLPSSLPSSARRNHHRKRLALLTAVDGFSGLSMARPCPRGSEIVETCPSWSAVRVPSCVCVYGAHDRIAASAARRAPDIPNVLQVLMLILAYA
ncbi:hypothetical protein V8C44DRAFT_240805 [Trichoderma aethiopicum]